MSILGLASPPQPSYAPADRAGWASVAASLGFLVVFVVLAAVLILALELLLAAL